MKGELWLARNQDDPKRTVGWIWEKHVARILPEESFGDQDEFSEATGTGPMSNAIVRAANLESTTAGAIPPDKSISESGKAKSRRRPPLLRRQPWYRHI